MDLAVTIDGFVLEAHGNPEFVKELNLEKGAYISWKNSNGVTSRQLNKKEWERLRTGSRLMPRILYPFIADGPTAANMREYIEEAIDVFGLSVNVNPTVLGQPGEVWVQTGGVTIPVRMEALRQAIVRRI